MGICRFAGQPQREENKSDSDRSTNAHRCRLIGVLGVVLANINPWFIGLSAFVGAGLIFAGVTDYCPMMAALARMPWNRGQACAPCKAWQSEPPASVFA